MRNLATIQIIEDIKPIEKADFIELASVLGWQVVINKRDNFKVGDKVIYIEIDSILPDIPVFEFMKDTKFRVKTRKFRKQVSQGLCMPLSILPEGKYKVGDDVTDIMGIKKYDVQAAEENKFVDKESRSKLVKFLCRFKIFRKFYLKKRTKYVFPTWISKTDQERVQNLPRLFNTERTLKTKLSCTEKMDGTSATFFIQRQKRVILKDTFDFGVCSRNYRLKEDNSHYWKIAKQYGIEEFLLEQMNLFEGAENIVIQGEIIGERIQKNKYDITGLDFYVFDFIVNSKLRDEWKLSNEEISTHLEFYAGSYGIKHVPIVEEDYVLPDTIEDLVEFAKGNSVINKKVKREGLVLRNKEKNISFKVINPDFLLKYDE